MLSDKFTNNENNIIRRYNIFISSTYTNLKNHRKYAIDTIARSNNFPICMELFHSTDQISKDYITKKIEDCDIFVIILGLKYGDPVYGLIDEKNVSFTHFEYIKAKEFGKKILCFVTKNSEFINAETCDDLKKFRNELYKDNRIISEFSDKEPNSIVSPLSVSVNSMTREMISNGYGGWVKGDLYNNLLQKKYYTKSQSDSPIFNLIVSRFSNFDHLTSRSAEQIQQKQLSAEYFWSNFQTPIFFRKKCNIFFEAGSTIDYFSTYLLDILLRNEHLRKENRNIKLFFNGVYSKVLYDLREKDLPIIENISYLPSPPIIKKYGKTIGCLANLPYLPPLFCTPGEFNDEENVAINELSSEISTNLKNNGVLLLSFSGLLINENFVPCTESYRNYIFKRAVFNTEENFVICLDDTKIDRRFNITDDHYKIFSLPEWDDFLCGKSVCFVIASEVTKDSDDFEMFLEERKFRWLERDNGKFCTKIFMNEKFQLALFDKIIEKNAL